MTSELATRAARLEREIERVYQLHPQLRHPAAPIAPSAPPRGIVQISQEFAALADQVRTGDFRLRAPTESPAGVSGPFITDSEYCLDPVFPRGAVRLRWFDASLSARDGDFVLVRLTAEELYTHLQAVQAWPAEKREAWFATYGQPGPIACKWLRDLGGRYYLCTNEGAIPLGQNRILGVLRYCLINGRPVFGCGEPSGDWRNIAEACRAHEIDIGAASGAVDTERIQDEAVTNNVIGTSSIDIDLALNFGGAYGTVGSANYTVPSGQTWRLSVEYECWATIGAAAGNPAGNFRALVNGGEIQEIRGFNTNMASQEHHFSWTHVADFGAGAHSFTIEGRATSGTATKRHSTVKITGLKR